MYLKRLEMQGFKSFADKTILEFRPGITGVIGPNGSGKSNISDAIRWILGEQSMKSLRGNKTQDIIFAGTQNRKSLGFAEASLVFDNTDGTLPIEFSEVTITRKIYRSGETGYYINKAPCRLKDVIELFMDTGIGRDGYSIIGQGKVDEILSNKSEDRRHIFEEAAGIVKYRARKEETEKKLEQTKLNLLRINDIIIEIEGNLEPLQLQSDKAKKYLNLKEELKNIEIGLFLYNIDKYKKDLEALVQDEEIMKSTLNQEEGKLEKIKILKEELKDEIDEITTKIEEMQNIGFESQKQIEQCNSNINVAEAKIQNNKEIAERNKIEISELQEKIASLKNDIEQKESKKSNLKENKAKFENELKEKEEELAKLTASLSSKELEMEEIKKNQEKIDELEFEEKLAEGDYEAEFPEYYFANPNPYFKIAPRPNGAPLCDYSLMKRATGMTEIIPVPRNLHKNKKPRPPRNVVQSYKNNSKLSAITAMPPTRPSMAKWCSPYSLADGKSSSKEIKTMIPATMAKITPKSTSFMKGPKMSQQTIAPKGSVKPEKIAYCMAFLREPVA